MIWLSTVGSVASKVTTLTMRPVFLAQAFLEAAEIVAAVVVVLVQHADLGVLDVGQDVLGVDHRLGVVVGLEAHGPREVLGIAPLRRAGGDVELRHLLLVHVLVDRRVARRAERLEEREDLVLLDELADHFHRLGRAITVVERDELDLAAVDAAGIVDALEIGIDRLGDGGVGRGRSAIGVGVSDLDLGVGGTVIVFLLRERRGRTGQKGERRRAAHETTPSRVHCRPPRYELCGSFCQNRAKKKAALRRPSSLARLLPSSLQLPSAAMTSPNRSQVSPLKRCSWTAWIG